MHISVPNFTAPALPTEVVTPEQEVSAAEIFARVEVALRQIEESRTEITKPQNAAIRAVNAQAKAVSEPFEDAKLKLAAVLSDYRQSYDVQQNIAQRRKLEMLRFIADRDGDTEGMQFAEGSIKALTEIVSPSVKTSTGLVVRYRQNLEIESIDLEELPEDFFMRVPDEKRIRDHIKGFGDVRGVVTRWSMRPFAVDLGKDDDV